MEPLKIEIKKNEMVPEVSIWQFAGDLGSASVESINRNFSKLLEGKHLYTIAEMSKVTYISSSAVGDLMECRQILIGKGGDLVIAGLSLDLKTKLNQMGVTKIFKFHNDLRTAINAYSWEVERKPENVWLSFPPELAFVPPVRHFVSRVARQKGYGQRDSFRIETIVDEACNNAVEHGVPDKSRDIELFLKIDPAKIEIEVVNLSDPKKINSLKAISKSILGTEEKKFERGRGLSLIKMLSNDLAIDFSGKGTTVHVTKLREE